MEFLPIIYLIYMFIALYMLSFFLIVYFRNRKSFFAFPEAKKIYTLSVLVPAYNEEKTIKDTIKHIFDTGYKGIIEVLVINDNSKDNTKKIVEGLQKEYPKIRLLNNETNLGKAGGLNRALEYAKGELVAVIDADSYPAEESITKMTGFFNDPKVGAVTCPVLARNRERFFANIQGIEYKVISFGRKLLEYVEAIYVTPGPLALYRKTALDDIKGFDTKNMTEDIEATWHLAYNGWDRKMCLSTYVTSTVPERLRAWWVQRRRWNIGGLQSIWKYRDALGKKGMLGWFIIPFFILNMFLGLVGLTIFSYLMVSRIISNFLLTKYSITAGTPVLSMTDLYITPSILNYLGIVLFIFGLLFTLLVLAVLNEKILKKQNILNIPFYLIVYLILYPFIMLNAIYHLAKGKRVWR